MPGPGAFHGEGRGLGRNGAQGRSTRRGIGRSGPGCRPGIHGAGNALQRGVGRQHGHIVLFLVRLLIRDNGGMAQGRGRLGLRLRGVLLRRGNGSGFLRMGRVPGRGNGRGGTQLIDNSLLADACAQLHAHFLGDPAQLQHGHGFIFFAHSSSSLRYGPGKRSGIKKSAICRSRTENPGGWDAVWIFRGF